MCDSDQWYLLISEIFRTPDSVEIVAAFSAAFVLPILGYLVAWAFARVIAFMDD